MSLSNGATVGALQGLRIVELASERTALCTKMMADMGAEVVVVEPPEGAPMRRLAPFLENEPGIERSLHWWHYNAGKMSVTLDWTREDGRLSLCELLRSADFFVDGEDPGRLSSHGLGYEQLHPLMPHLIAVSITPFGSSGPRCNEQATDLTLLASGGPVWSCGYDDHSIAPVRGWGYQAFNVGALYAVIGALVAHVARQTTGAGQHVDVNLNAAANVTTEGGSYTWLVARKTVQRQTGRHADVYPSMPTQVQCADGRWVNTGVPPRVKREFEALWGWLEELDLIAEFPESVFIEMGMQRERLDLSGLADDDEVQAIYGAGREAMNLIASRLSAYEFFIGAHRRGMPVGVINSPDELFDDPHFIARGFPTRVEHEDLAKCFVYPGGPYRFSRTPWRIQRRPPHLGEHNAIVFGKAKPSD